MAIFLSEPITKKISNDISTSKLICGSSSMQGWRMTQEDAHNYILDYDKDTSFFAVYDGHLGHEVALYCSENLPDFLKQTGQYKTGDIKKALEDAFLGLDAKIAASEILMKLDYEDSEEDKNEAEEEEEEDLECENIDEENMYDLYEEASMPIEQVMEKYTSKLSHSTEESEKHSGSGLVKQHELNECTNASCTSQNSLSQVPVIVSSSSNMKTEASSSSVDKRGKKELSKISTPPEKRVDSPDSSISKNDAWIHSNKSKEISNIDSSNQNGEVESTQGSKSSNCELVTSSSMPQENGTVSKKGKGKALMKTKGVKQPKINTRPKRSTRQLYKKLVDFEENSDEEEESEDENDKDFIGPNDESSDDNGEGINVSIDDHLNEENSDEEEEEKDEEEVTGFNCGCTALVALIRDKELYVANAGDSKCVVCRNGKAIELSTNHKPINKEEHDRIIKAGGHVTDDGKINDGLNLSRAIGDHKYKQNKTLSEREQIITAFPEVQTLELVPEEDEFMFLACDGIWKCMDNQQVIDFIRGEIKEGKKELSKICEEIFDKCLAKIPSENGNDNMTAIIVQFKLSLLKRSADSFEESGSRKKLKIKETADSTESNVI